MDLDAATRLIETACRDFNNPSTQAQAEEVLQQFRSAPRPYETCRHILEHSTDAGAQFQAILALKDAALREWTTALDPSMRRDLLRYLLHAAVVRFAGGERRLVRTQSAAAAATLLKRVWGEASTEEQINLMSEIDALATQVGTAEARCASLQVLNCIVQEFSTSTATPMGMPWDYHEQCRLQLQEGFLMGILKYALEVGRGCMELSLSGKDSGTCATSLTLLSSLLAWDHYSSFQNTDRSQMRRPDQSGLLRSNPPATWREILLDEHKVAWILQLSRSLQQAPHPDRSLQRSLGQVIIQFCSMSGDIFVHDRKNFASTMAGQSHLDRYSPAAHLARFLPVLLQQLSPTHEIAKKLFSEESDAILDNCRAILAASSVHRSSGFSVAALRISVHPDTLFRTLSDATIEILKAGDATEVDDAADILLDAWTELVTDPSRGAIAESDDVAKAAGGVFLAVMERELSRAAGSAAEDEIEYEGGEEAQLEAWLSDVAIIGRAACAYVIPNIMRELHQCQTTLQQCMQSQQDPGPCLERLCWVLQSASSILADAADGEVPQIPLAIADACAAFSSTSTADNDPAISLALSLIGFGEFCKDNAGNPMISPRLMEELCRCLGRWADTYLLSSDISEAVDANTNAQIQNAFGAEGNGSAVAQTLFGLLNTVLTRFPGETALHTTACKTLLAALVRRDEATRVVVWTQGWRLLSEAFATGNNAVLSLEANVQRILTRNLIAGAIGYREQHLIREYVDGLLRRLSEVLLSTAHLNKADVQKADKVAHVVSAIQCLRGAAKGSRGDAVHVVHAHIEGVQASVLHLLSIYQSHPSAYITMLEFAADVVAFIAPYLEGIQQVSLFQWSVGVVGQFASDARAPTTGTDEKLEEQVMSICAMLRLLSELTNADAPDQDMVAAAVFSGLDHILPLIQNEHLKFPHLRRDFFWLLVGMVEAHAYRVTALPPNTLHGILAALSFGINLRDEPESEAAVFEAVAALARHQVTSHINLFVQKQESGLETLFDALLRRVLINDPTFEAVDFAAEAAHPLLLVDTDAAIYILRVMLGQIGADEETIGVVHGRLNELRRCAESGRAMDRQSRRQFQDAFRKFVLDVRNIIKRV